MINKKLLAITEKIIKKQNGISFEDACEIAALPEAETFDLIACANRIRENFKGNLIIACSIVNAKSGRCSEDCAFCAQSAHHQTSAETYPLLSEEKLLDRALALHREGATRYSIVSSGFSLSSQDLDTVCQVVPKIIRQTGMTVCASLGTLSESAARDIKASGVVNYHHNLETAQSYFDRICTTHKYEEDIRTVRAASDAGMRACCGGILGMGETWHQRAELAFTIRSLDVPSIPLNFLNPIPGTPMENRPLIPPTEALKCIALFRFIHPDRDIIVCGGREKTLGDFQSWIFHAGANGLMVGNYLTTAGRNTGEDMKMVRQLGLVAEDKRGS